MQRYACAAVVGLLGLTSCPGLGSILRSYGYTELRPASNLLAPGSMVWVKHTSPFTAGVICTQKASLGADFKPLASTTTSSDQTKSTKRSFDLGAQYLEVIKADAKFSDVDTITAHLDHASILELSDTDVAEHIANRDPACSRAIKERAAGDFKVTMISSALQADVKYSVVWNISSTLDAGAKVALLQDLAVKLNLSGSHVSDQSIEAKGLYWGIRDDEFLAHLSEPDAVTPVGQNSRAIPSDHTPHLELQPDVN